MFIDIVRRSDPTTSSVERSPRPDRSWLPEAGDRRIVEATLIEALECDGQPFFRLSSAR